MKRIPVGGSGNDNLYRDAKTGIIYFRQYKTGKGRLEKSTGTAKVSEARKIADRFRAELFGVRKSKGRELIEDLFPAWIDQKRPVWRKNTISSATHSWKHLEPFIGGLLPEEVTRFWWESEYIPKKRLERPGRKFFNDKKWLNMFLLHCQYEGIIKSRPKLVNPDPKRKRGKVYSDEEISRLQVYFYGDVELQVLMALTMGMRLSEIILLQWDRVDKTHWIINLRAEDTKIKKPRSFAISEPVKFLLRGRKFVGPFVFPNPKDPTRPMGRQGNKSAWATVKRKAGVKGRFHDLRHTFLTRAFKQPGVNPALICDYAGLSMEEAQKTYLHFTPEDTRKVAGLVGYG